MTTKSKFTPTRRKSNTASRFKVIKLTPGIIEARTRAQAVKEFWDFIEKASTSEMRIVGHLRETDFSDGIVGAMKEVRRLLSEYSGKCKVIPFPMPRKVENTTHSSLVNQSGLKRKSGDALDHKIH